jgi:sulfur carrier protein
MTATIRVNGTEQALTAERGLHALLDQFGVRQGRGCAVAVNGTVVPAAQWPGRQVAPGDEIEILRIVGGG